MTTLVTHSMAVGAILTYVNLAWQTICALIILGIGYFIVSLPFVWIIHGSSKQIKERLEKRNQIIQNVKGHVKGTVRTIETINNAVDEAIKQDKIKIIK